jgi:hypothetical protein
VQPAHLAYSLRRARPRGSSLPPENHVQPTQERVVLGHVSGWGFCRTPDGRTKPAAEHTGRWAARRVGCSSRSASARLREPVALILIVVLEATYSSAKSFLQGASAATAIRSTRGQIRRRFIHTKSIGRSDLERTTTDLQQPPSYHVVALHACDRSR